MKYRAPTVKEGADFIEICITREYKRRCIAKWREWYGDALADQIINELKGRRRKKRYEEKKSG